MINIQLFNRKLFVTILAGIIISNKDISSGELSVTRCLSSVVRKYDDFRGKKFKFLADKNPELLNFKNKLDLDLDF